MYLLLNFGVSAALQKDGTLIITRHGMCSTKEETHHGVYGAEKLSKLKTDKEGRTRVIVSQYNQKKNISLYCYCVHIIAKFFGVFWNQSRVIYTDSRHIEVCGVTENWDDMYGGAETEVADAVNEFLRHKQAGKLGDSNINDVSTFT